MSRTEHTFGDNRCRCWAFYYDITPRLCCQSSPRISAL